MTIASNLGFPPLGAARELKRATEGYWAGKLSAQQLLATGAELRRRHWELQRAIGIDRIPANDFSFYDRMLDTCALVGAVPPRYGWKGNEVDPDTYFAMARGSQGKGRDVTAMEMTKWFDTNYHYIVPELERGQSFRLASKKPVAEFREAKALGIDATPVLIGPITFLLLAKTKGTRFDRLSLLDALLPVYAEALSALSAAGATWIQLDEPCLALDRSEAERAAYLHAYSHLAKRGARCSTAPRRRSVRIDCGSLPRARCCTRRSISTSRRNSIRSSRAGSPSRNRSFRKSSRSRKAIVVLWKPAARRRSRGGPRNVSTTRPFSAGRPPFLKKTECAPRRTPCAGRHKWPCHAIRRRPLAHSRRPRKCARRDGSCTIASSRQRNTTPSSSPKSGRPSHCRKRSVSMCSCTANSSATTWSSISESSSPASRSPSTAGSNRTAPGT